MLLCFNYSGYVLTSIDDTLYDGVHSFHDPLSLLTSLPLE